MNTKARGHYNYQKKNEILGLCNTFLTKPDSGFLGYSKTSPQQASAISNFLSTFALTYASVPNAKSLYSRLLQRRIGINGQWWNTLSEMRCAAFIQDLTHQKIKQFDAKLSSRKGSPDADFLLQDNSYWDVVSFQPNFTINEQAVIEERTIHNIAIKVIEKFSSKPGLHFLVIDDVFSYDSTNYQLLSYFFEGARTDRADSFQTKLGHYLDSIIYLSFNNEITAKPTKLYVGSEISCRYNIRADYP